MERVPCPETWFLCTLECRIPASTLLSYLSSTSLTRGSAFLAIQGTAFRDPLRTGCGECSQFLIQCVTGLDFKSLFSLYARLPPQPSLDGILLPPFVPGPHGSWIWKDPYRAPKSVWDLVVKTPTFVPIPVIEEKVEISAEYRAMFDRPPSPPPTGTNTANIDPCYQTPRSLPPLTTTIDVLPTIPEKRHVRFTPEMKQEDGASSHGGFRRRRIRDEPRGGRAGENE